MNVTLTGPDVAYAFMVGMEFADSRGGLYIVTGVHVTADGADGAYIGLKRSTWWRRLYYRIRRVFT